ncbi:hypothetical protein QOT17_010256 [Balamuthia mandrillaris]
MGKVQACSFCQVEACQLVASKARYKEHLPPQPLLLLVLCDQQLDLLLSSFYLQLIHCLLTSIFPVTWQAWHGVPPLLCTLHVYI